MKASNTERLTAVGSGRRSWVGQAILVVLLAIGPERLARVISFVTSTITFPLTRSISVAGNRYEVFNLELLMIYLIAVIGLNLLVQVGLLSVGHTAPFAVGAYFVAISSVKYHWPFYGSLAGAAVMTGVLGLALGIPSLRLGIFTFAMVTLGYAIVAIDLANGWQSVTGGGPGFAGVTLPKPFDTQNTYYWLLAILLVAAYVVGRNYIRSPLGRAAAAVSASPVAAQAVGINVHVSKLRGFALASAFAGVAGGLYAALLGFIAPDSFTLDLAVLFVLMVLLGGGGTIAGPIVGAIILFRIPLAAQNVTSQPGQWSLLIYGAVLLASVHFFPRGIMSGWAALRQLLFQREAERPERRRPEVRGMLERVSLELSSALEVRGIAKNLSGVQALRGVDLAVEPGTIHALIGPNGSGKTTLLNVMSGYLEPDAGQVFLLGQDAKHWPVHRRARRGLARTFQTPYIFEDATCRDNVLIALDLHRRHDAVSYVLRMPGAFREERRAYNRALALLEAVGLEHETTTPAGRLPPGERRLLELARVLALEPKVVLMDEPAAGLTSHEIEELDGAIRALRDAGVAVLLVEHHVDFVLQLADTVTVIDFGDVIARGDPEKVRTDPAVVSAYLGQPEETLSEEIELRVRASAVEGELEARLQAEAPAKGSEGSSSA